MKIFKIRSGQAPMIQMAAGENASLVMDLYDPDPAQRGKPWDLTNKRVVCTARPRSCCGIPSLTDPVLFAKVAAITQPPTLGLASVALLVADTDGNEGEYALDVWVESTASEDRTQATPVGQLVVRTPSVIPGQP